MSGDVRQFIMWHKGGLANDQADEQSRLVRESTVYFNTKVGYQANFLEKKG